MGSHLTVESELGKGSEFRFSLPTRAEDAPAVRDALTMEPTAEGGRVLVVEDSEVNREVMGTMLRNFDLSPTFAANGQEAVDLCQTQNFDLIFMDVHMPVMDGITATRRIREHEGPGQRQRIVALTGLSNREDAETCFSAGADEVLTKPVSLVELQRMIAQISHRPQWQAV